MAMTPEPAGFASMWVVMMDPASSRSGCGGGYWSHEGDVPGYNTIGAVSSDGRTTVVLSINSNVDHPVLAAEYRLIDHVMCNHGHHRGNS